MRRKCTFNYIFSGHIDVNGRQIYAEIIRSPHAHITNQVVFFVPGGPGFGGTEANLTDVTRMYQLAHENNLALPHMIMFDPLGTGKSEAAHDLSEYNLENYALLNIGLLDELRQLMGYDKLRVNLIGGSFGGIMVWKMKQLMSHADHLQLMQMITIVGANGAGMRDYAMRFLEENVPEFERRQHMIAAQTKLFDGTINDQADYLSNFVLVMAGLYAGNGAAILETWQGRLIRQFPVLFAKTLSMLNSVIDTFGYEHPELRFQSHILDHCSVPVLNTFFRNNFDGFSVLDYVDPVRDSDIPITLFTAEHDHVVDAGVALAVQSKLQDSSAVFVWTGPHMRDGVVREFFVRQATSLLANGRLDEELITNSGPLLHTSRYNSEYLQLLQRTHASQIPSSAPSQSYSESTSMLRSHMIQQSPQSSSSSSDHHVIVTDIHEAISPLPLQNSSANSSAEVMQENPTASTSEVTPLLSHR